MVIDMLQFMLIMNALWYLIYVHTKAPTAGGVVAFSFVVIVSEFIGRLVQ